MKKTAWLCLIAALCLMLCSCGAIIVEETETVTIGWVQTVERLT